MNELTKKLMCVSMRNGVEIWIENEKTVGIKKALSVITQHRFLSVDDQILNTADIVGVFSSETMGDVTRRKNGHWKCNMQKWHEKGSNCSCLDEKTLKKIQEQQKKSLDCGKCINGFLVVDNMAKICNCQKC